MAGLSAPAGPTASTLNGSSERKDVCATLQDHPRSRTRSLSKDSFSPLQKINKDNNEYLAKVAMK